MKWKRIIPEVLVLLLIAAVAGAAANLFRPESRKLAWIIQVSPPPKDPALLYMEIAPEAALNLQRAGVLFIDARRSDQYEQGHIEKAISIPVWESDADRRISALTARGLQPDAPIVVYCSGGMCEDAVHLAQKLAMSFYNIYLYKDGFPDWSRRNWPVTRGKKP
jgi:rhodanese-related sulfurtransferase